MSEDARPGAYSDGEIDTNATDNTHLWDLVEARYSRRQTLGGIAATTMAVFGSSLLAACGASDGELGDINGRVSAGQNGNSRAGKIVRLTGTVEGTNTGVVGWEQVSGPAVSLVNAGTAEASFIAPAVAAPTALVFRFSARNSNGQIISADSTITIDVAALDFNPVAKNLNDLVTVPAGYTVTVLYRTGDPLAAGVPAYANNGSDANFAQRAGDHHDGMYWYGLNAAGTARDDNSSSRGLLTMNHENINQTYLHAAGATGNGTSTPRPEDEARKEIEAHGVSVVEVARSGTGVWSYNQNSSFNRRVTPNTPVQFNGPLRGHPALKTAFSPDGTQGRGTINNCALGFTLWGTFLTCEENWAGYFRRAAGDNANRNARELAAFARYGIPQGANGNYGWASVTPASASDTTFRRWNISVDTAQPADGTGDYRNEANQFGWVVEIDPYDSTKAPRKRTALGRLGHEGAWHGQWVSGRKVTIYTGDDARNDYFYKFISNNAWNPADAQAADRLAIGDKYFDNGTLYVAKFNANGTGTWIPLTFGQNGITPASPVFPFQDQNDVLLYTRLAADAVGATKMDRPEWTATHYVTGEIYLTLTNNRTNERPLAATDAANPRHYADPKTSGSANPLGNPNGHILRLREAGDNSEALTFTWDIYLFGAGADLDAANINLSGLDATNDFSSPDGIWFARPTNPSGQIYPLLWIQTDDGAYTDVTNNQMLIGIPGHTGDGGAKTITNTGTGGATATQTTFVGAQPGAKLKRFMVGPKECELTGVDTTPDGRTLFVNIQHPGELGNPGNITSNWPNSQTGVNSGRPRSATIVVTKDDGGVVGL
ncbi:MAG TPA: alkaline phosphatase PhoX [Allosphingosinicella sp.]|nr:alkaline phosphatase PhoX [Allosphingosinicella sp.]